MVCLVTEYIRESAAPECIFQNEHKMKQHNKHKTMFNEQPGQFFFCCCNFFGETVKI